MPHSTIRQRGKPRKVYTKGVFPYLQERTPTHTIAGTPRCQATTLHGAQCRRGAMKDSSYCNILSYNPMTEFTMNNFRHRNNLNDQWLEAHVPSYRSKKVVRLIKLVSIERHTTGFYTYYAEDINLPTMAASPHDEVHKRTCEADGSFPIEPGFLVFYPDGFVSWAPTRAIVHDYVPMDNRGIMSPPLIQESQTQQESSDAATPDE